MDFDDYDPQQAKHCLYLLKLPCPFTRGDVAVARREMARLWHPDRFEAAGGDELRRAQDRMVRANAACDYLEHYYEVIARSWPCIGAPDNTFPHAAPRIGEEFEYWIARQSIAAKVKAEHLKERFRRFPNTPVARDERQAAASQRETEWQSSAQARQERKIEQKRQAILRAEADLRQRRAEADQRDVEIRQRDVQVKQSEEAIRQHALEVSAQQEHEAARLRDAVARAESDLKARQSEIISRLDVVANTEQELQKRVAALCERQAALDHRETDLLQREAAAALREAAAQSSPAPRHQIAGEARSENGSALAQDAPRPTVAGFDYLKHARQQRVREGRCPDCGAAMSQWWDTSRDLCGNCGSPSYKQEQAAEHATLLREPAAGSGKR